MCENNYKWAGGASNSSRVRCVVDAYQVHLNLKHFTAIGKDAKEWIIYDVGGARNQRCET